MFRSRKPKNALVRPNTQANSRPTYCALGVWLRVGLIVVALSNPGRVGRAQSAESPAQNARIEPASETGASSTKPGPSAAIETDAARVRAETIERLKALDTATGAATTVAGSAPAGVAGAQRTAAAPSGATAAAAPTSPVSPANKALHDLLQERVRWLEEYNTLSAALHELMNPEPSPEAQAKEAKAELDLLQKTQAEATRAPDSLLPPRFRAAMTKAHSAAGSEMKEALEATAEELKEWKTKLESTKSETARSESAQTDRRGERDKQFQKVATLKAKTNEIEAAAVDALTSAARRLAEERLVNFRWETRVETLRLRRIEAQLALEAKLARVRDLNMNVYAARVQVIERTLDQMRGRYRVAAENYDRDLTSAAAKEESKAQSADTPPLERFRARRTAELLVLESWVLRHEQALATSPPPSLDEERALADRAEADFARIKELLDDGDVSRLDAIRLTNEFRRIGPERGRLLKNEMAMVEAQLQFYENALTSAEIELIQDSLHDRFEQELSQERVPRERLNEGAAMSTEFERKHHALLLRHRTALQSLCDRASHTLQQVSRRLAILDEEYGFIRTHIFWVRDQDPIGPATLAQGARDCSLLAWGLVRLAEEITQRSLWGQPSAEFLASALAAAALPFGLLRLRRVLTALIERSLPAPPG